MLFIEYDHDDEENVQLIALIDASEENDEDPSGEHWLEWRRSLDDKGIGCCPVTEADNERMDAIADPNELRHFVMGVVRADAAAKLAEAEESHLAAVAAGDAPASTVGGASPSVHIEGDTP
jgi:hypothetical protein